MPFSLKFFGHKKVFNFSKPKRYIPSKFSSSKSNSKKMSPFNDSLTLPLFKDVKCYSKGFKLSDGTTMTLQVNQKDESMYMVKMIGTDKTLKDINFLNINRREISIHEINDIEFECCLSSECEKENFELSELFEQDYTLHFQIHFKLQRIKFGLSQNLLFDFGHFQKLTSSEYVQFYVRKNVQLPKLYCSCRKVYNQPRYRIMFNTGSDGKRCFENPRMVQIHKTEGRFEIIFTEPKSVLEIEYLKILKESIDGIGEGKLKFKCDLIRF